MPTTNARPAVPLFDDGMPLSQGAPEITDAVRRAALHLNRARHGAEVGRNREAAQLAAHAAAEAMQEYAGSHVSYSASLAIVWHLVDVTCAVMDPAAAGL